MTCAMQCESDIFSVIRNFRISSPSSVWTSLSEEDKHSSTPRHVSVQRFLSQPFHVAEQFTGLKGVLVPIEETYQGL
jgi:hypothetical protein